MRLLYHSFRDALWMIPRLVRQQWPWLLGLTLVQFAAGQYMQYTEDILNQRAAEDIGLMATTAGASVSFDLMWYAVYISIVVKAASPRAELISFSQLAQDINQLLIENLRVMARVIFWLPLLILPAAYQYLRLVMVPFVVLDDADYDAGRVDALARSRHITRHHAFVCLLALLLSLLAEPVVRHFVSGDDGALWRNPVGTLAAVPLTAFVELWSVLALYCLYQRMASSVSRTISAT